MGTDALLLEIRQKVTISAGDAVNRTAIRVDFNPLAQRWRGIGVGNMAIDRYRYVPNQSPNLCFRGGNHAYLPWIWKTKDPKAFHSHIKFLSSYLIIYSLVLQLPVLFHGTEYILCWPHLRVCTCRSCINRKELDTPKCLTWCRSTSVPVPILLRSEKMVAATI